MKSRIEQVTSSPGGRIIAISDIHGYVHYLRGLLEKIQFSPQDTLVIAGDMIEKGPESLATVRLVMDLKKTHPHIYASQGNVERSRLSALIDTSDEADREFLLIHWSDRNVWKRGLFLDMMEELGIPADEVSENTVKDVKRRLLENYRGVADYLWNLPTILTAGNFIFAHAGVPTDDLDALQETEEQECLRRNAFLNEDVQFDRYVVAGHWPVSLYREDIDSLNPICDPQKHIIAIDGGCALKIGAQLNALILPAEAKDMSGAVFESYDDFPVITADRDQKARAGTIHMRYFNCGVEIVEELDDMVRLRHLNSGRVFLAPRSYLYQRSGKLLCNDYSDMLLDIRKGDRLSVVQTTSVGKIVKKDGVIGWYMTAPEQGAGR